MFVINPDPYSTPCYRIGPFTTKDIFINSSLPDGDSIDQYFLKRFGGKGFSYTINGREAIRLALSHYDLKKDDVVTIFTTSGNFYISGCVTREIERFCTWNREITTRTKVLFVNHEFGVAYPEMESLAMHGIPIIEDCCPSFFSQDKNHQLGQYGDFAVYSFSKIFPIQFGGLLLNNRKLSVEASTIDKESLKYIKKVCSYCIQEQDQLLNKRASIYQYGLEKFKQLGFSERFTNDRYTVPYAMLLNNHGIVRDLPALKDFLWRHGIHSSVFYGEDAFFLPSHQNLTETDVDYFLAVTNAFINDQNLNKLEHD